MANSMQRAFTWISIAYGVALVVAIVVVLAMPYDHTIKATLYADIAATVVIFAFSVAFRNSSFYDAYWSVVPPVIAAFWIGSSTVAGVPGSRQALVFALVCLWGARLTYNWTRGWTGLDHEDWRYVKLQEQTGSAYWLVSFGGIHMLPTLWVFAGCLPLYASLAVGTRPLGALDVVAAIVTLGAIGLEARADQELAHHRASKPEKGSILATGVWSWSRHPNYLGEMGFWWGLFLFGLAAAPGWWWTGVGALAITLMFRFVSLPMIETRMSESRPGWADHAARTSLVLPRPPR